VREGDHVLEDGDHVAWNEDGVHVEGEAEHMEGRGEPVYEVTGTGADYVDAAAYAYHDQGTSSSWRFLF
jgi:hypothetical protein